jgi:CheY-like chemotaxis protein
MRFDELTPALLRRAVDIYLAHAYPAGAARAPLVTARDFDGAPTASEWLARFERPDDTRVVGVPSYALRLGNYRYPFMKLVVEEYLVDEEVFFSVDTHDNLDVRPSAPDWAQWLELKAFNRELKDEIERAWLAEGLPTFEKLREMCEALSPREREGSKSAHVLVVDDERSVAIGVAALLRGRGYDVELAHTGEQALERAAHEPAPDLVLLDYELPGLDGEELLRRMRADPRLARCKLVMATAASIDLARLGKVDGLLAKPYRREHLFALLRALLEARPRP